MSEHRATVRWSFAGEDFPKGRYSRAHSWEFDGGQKVLASSSPTIVPLPFSNPAGVDPEEAFVAALSSCHLLTFLDLARRAGHEIESYEDQAVGVLAKNAEGARWIATVTLTPKVRYREGTTPSTEAEEQLHHQAHQLCFIANSVKTEITVKRG
ncbi:MAG TPA: OsmC family protein [Polyangiaceae bacterium]